MDKSKIYPRMGDAQTVYLQSVITRPTKLHGSPIVYFVSNEGHAEWVLNRTLEAFWKTAAPPG